MLGWVANGPQQLTGVTHTCYTTTVGRVCARSCVAVTYFDCFVSYNAEVYRFP